MSESIWKKKADLAVMNSLSENTMVSHVGIQFTEIGSDHLTASMPVDVRTVQPLGQLHGGASAVLIETLGSVASTWAVEENEYCVGIEINVNHVRAKQGGVVFGTATPVQRGSTIQVWGVDVKDESGRLISTGRITLAVRQQRP